MKMQQTFKRIALMMLAGVQVSAAAIGIGESMVDTDVQMENIDGTMISFQDVKGDKGTLVIFTCNHCPFVERWQKEMVAIGNAYLKQGIGVIFINSNDPAVKGDTLEGMQALAAAEGYQFPYVVDSTSGVAKNFGAKKTPDVFLFDAEGKLVYQGAIGEGGRAPKPEGGSWLRDALDALIAGQPIETAQTKAVGCSIKFR